MNIIIETDLEWGDFKKILDNTVKIYYYYEEGTYYMFIYKNDNVYRCELDNYIDDISINDFLDNYVENAILCDSIDDAKNKSMLGV